MVGKIKDKFQTMNENSKIVYKNVILAFVVKGGALLITLFTLPAYIRFFNNDEVLGMWFTILSLLSWILNFDIGIGNGLRNHLSIAISTGNKKDSQKYISSAYFSIGMIVTGMTVTFCICSRYLNFNQILNISIDIVSERALACAVTIVFVGLMLQFLLKLINSILYSLQKSSINNLLVLCSNTMILLFVLILPSADNNTNIIIIALVYAFAIVLPLLIATLIVFSCRLKFAIPRFCFYSRDHAKRVLSLGGRFFILQIAYMIIMSTNEFFIARFVSNSCVVSYQIYYKVFSLGSTVFALALTPIWSVVTKAKAENKLPWIYATYKKFMLLAGVFCVGEFLIIPMMKWIIRIWIGESKMLDINCLNSILFAILGCLMILNSVLSSVVNGLAELKIQGICFTVGALTKPVLSYIFVCLIGSWIGVVVANIVCMGVYCIAQPIYMKKYFEKVE